MEIGKTVWDIETLQLPNCYPVVSRTNWGDDYWKISSRLVYSCLFINVLPIREHFDNG